MAHLLNIDSQDRQKDHISTNGNVEYNNISYFNLEKNRKV